jgi:hypothetical protein
VDAATVVPATGAGLVLATMVGYWFRQYGTDRQREADGITREQERTQRAETRVMEAMAREAAAQVVVDVERALRRKAEDALTQAEAQLGIQRTKAKWYSEEVDRLRFYLPPEIRPGVLPDPPARGEPGD